MHNSKEGAYNPAWREDGDRHQRKLPGRGRACAKVQRGTGQAKRRQLHREAFSLQDKEMH